jgi:hypothetical protein
MMPPYSSFPTYFNEPRKLNIEQNGYIPESSGMQRAGRRVRHDFPLGKGATNIRCKQGKATLWP